MPDPVWHSLRSIRAACGRQDRRTCWQTLLHVIDHGTYQLIPEIGVSPESGLTRKRGDHFGGTLRL